MQKLKLFRNFKFSWKISLITVILASSMIWASTWQWERYKWKVGLVNSYIANADSKALDFPTNAKSIDDFKDVLHRKVKISGKYDFSRQMLVRNRKHSSGPGFWLLTPLKIDGTNLYVIVSRGFIPFKDSNKEDWLKYNYQETEELYAVVQRTVDQMSSFAPKSNTKSQGEFNEKWLYPDIREIAKQLPYPLITDVFLQKLKKPTEPEFPAQALSIRVPPSTHFGYTIEWAILALLTLASGLFLQTFRRKK